MLEKCSLYSVWSWKHLDLENYRYLTNCGSLDFSTFTIVWHAYQDIFQNVNQHANMSSRFERNAQNLLTCHVLRWLNTFLFEAAPRRRNPFKSFGAAAGQTRKSRTFPNAFRDDILPQSKPSLLFFLSILCCRSTGEATGLDLLRFYLGPERRHQSTVWCQVSPSQSQYRQF